MPNLLHRQVLSIRLVSAAYPCKQFQRCTKEHQAVLPRSDPNKPLPIVISRVSIADSTVFLRPFLPSRLDDTRTKKVESTKVDSSELLRVDPLL